MVRLGIAICELLLIENLYLNLPEQSRWHVALPCVLLGSLACFDILLCADLALFHQCLIETLGLREVVLVGASFGGFVPELIIRRTFA